MAGDRGCANISMPTFCRRSASLARHARFVRFYQRSGLQSLARATGILKLLGMAELDALSPTIESEFLICRSGTCVSGGRRAARPSGAVLIGCVASVAFAELNRATIRVLTKNGIEVHVPEKQACCGALQLHAGLLDLAREQARRNIDAMLSPEFDAIVTQCRRMRLDAEGICRPVARTTRPTEKGRRNLRRRYATSTSIWPRWDCVEPKRKLHARVTYQDPCHLAHAQGIRSAPRQLLRHVGAEVVESPRADSCCGSAGVYNVVQNEISMKVLDEKMGFIASVEPEIIATANVGCMLQFRAGVERRKMNARVAHVVELLDEAY